MKLRMTALALSLALAGMAQAGSYSSFVVLGDSLSDAGTFKAVAGPGGKFTTNPGPVWSEQVAAALGVTPGAARLFTGTGFAENPAGTIWAQGGARVTGTPGVGMSMAQPVSNQLAGYLARNGGKADAGALHAVWAGANDVFFWTNPASNGGASSAVIQTNIGGAAQALVQQTAALQAAGARHLVVLNLPDMGKTPAALASGAAAAAGLSGVSQLYNYTLSNGLVAAGVNALQLDSYRLFGEILANPAAYGFSVTNTATACLPPGSSSLTCSAATLARPDADQTFVFADGVHPTTAGHRIVGDYVLSAVNAPQLAAQTAEQLGRLADARWQGSDARQRRFLDGSVADGGSEFYVDILAGDGDASARDGEAYGGTLGLDRNFGNGWFGGVSVGLIHDRQRVAGVGGATGSGLSVAAYGTHRLGAAYVSAAASLTSVDYDLNRSIMLGSNSRNESGSTSGTTKGVRFEAGYDLGQGAQRHGPFAGLTYGRNSMGGYDESSGLSTALRFGTQAFDTLRGSLGYQLSAQISDSFRLGGRLSVEHQFDDSRRDLSVGSMGTGTAMISSVGQDSGSYGRLAVNAEWKLAKEQALSADLVLTSRHEGSRDSFLRLGYLQRF